jgi:hypothetical protein
LLNQALTGAVDSSLRAKRRALGRVLAQVVEGDETTIDDSGLAIAALRNLESMHVAIMSRFFLHGAGPLLRAQSLDQIVRDKDGWISLEAGPAAPGLGTHGESNGGDQQHQHS